MRTGNDSEEPSENQGPGALFALLMTSGQPGNPLIQGELSRIMTSLPPELLMQIMQMTVQPGQQNALLQMIGQTFNLPPDEVQKLEANLKQMQIFAQYPGLLNGLLKSITELSQEEQKRFWAGDITGLNMERLLQNLARQQIDIAAFMQQCQTLQSTELMQPTELPKTSSDDTSNLPPEVLSTPIELSGNQTTEPPVLVAQYDAPAGHDEQPTPQPQVLDRETLAQFIRQAYQQLRQGGPNTAWTLNPDQLAQQADHTDPGARALVSTYDMLFHLQRSESGRDRQELTAAIRALDTLLGDSEIAEQLGQPGRRFIEQVQVFFDVLQTNGDLDFTTITQLLLMLQANSLIVPFDEVTIQALPLLIHATTVLQNARGKQIADPTHLLADAERLLALGEGYRSELFLPGMLTAYGYMLRGSVYASITPLAGREEGFKRALSDYDQALRFFTRESHPNVWAELHLNRSMILLSSGTGNIVQNTEQALEEALQALSVFTFAEKPLQWATAHEYCGEAYRLRMNWDRRRDLEQALEHYEEALRVFTPANIPQQWASTRIGRVRAKRGLLEQGISGNWREVRLTFLLREVSFAEEWLKLSEAYEALVADLTEVSTVAISECDSYNRADALYERAFVRASIAQGDRKTLLNLIFQDYQDALTVLTRPDYPERWADIHIKLAVILQRYTYQGFETDAEQALEKIDEALTVYSLEQTPLAYYRAQEMRALTLERLKRWPEAQQALLEAHRAEHFLLAHVRPGKELYDLLATFTRSEICLHHAQVVLHLEPPDKIGAILALENGRARHIALEQADLASTEAISNASDLADLVACLSGRHSALVYLAAGANVATSVEVDLHLALGIDTGIALILTLDADGQPQVAALELPDLTNLALTMRMEITTLEPSSNTSGSAEEFARTDQSRGSKSDKDFVLPIKLDEVVHGLGQRGLNKVACYLHEHEITEVTIVPYSTLALMPLNAIQVTLDDNSTHYLGELFDISLAPSACAARQARQQVQATQHFQTVLSAGKPEPQVSGFSHLPYAATEAKLLRELAHVYGYAARYLPPTEVTRAQLLTEFQHLSSETMYVDLALHTVYDAREPRHSYLVLAGSDSVPGNERRILLEELLNGTIRLTGVRLIVLAACRSSVTDMWQIPNEALGLAPAFLQAGCAGVIASLWKVDDRATYLLLTRFAQLYLEAHGELTPARALAMAQHWLREEATYQVVVNYNPLQTLLADTETTDWNIERLEEKALETPDALPFNEPKYWAGFVLSGY